MSWGWSFLTSLGWHKISPKAKPKVNWEFPLQKNFLGEAKIVLIRLGSLLYICFTPVFMSTRCALSLLQIKLFPSTPSPTVSIAVQTLLTVFVLDPLPSPLTPGSFWSIPLGMVCYHEGGVAHRLVYTLEFPCQNSQHKHLALFEKARYASSQSSVVGEDGDYLRTYNYSVLLFNRLEVGRLWGHEGGPDIFPTSTEETRTPPPQWKNIGEAGWILFF